ncbi:MAG: aldo/keto reductase [Pseudomonadota bacterium]
MEKRRLGQTDLDVSILCLGTMMFGDQITESDARAQMDACVDRGVTFFDTAELYTIPPRPETQGESERIVGRWIAERGNRKDIILATKVAGRAQMDWLRNGAECRLTKSQIIAAVERSLKNLQTDYIDLYQTHWPDRPVQLFGATLKGYVHYDDPGAPIEETLEAIDALVRSGKVRHVGVSNETPYGIMRHLEASRTRNLPRIVSIQNAYNLLNRTFEFGLAEIALEEQVGLLAYSPIAQGSLTGKYLDNAKPAGSRRAFMDRMQRYQKPNAEKAIRHYVSLAKTFDLHPAAFAMAFVTSRPFLTSNIFGANGLDQLDIIFNSAEITWTDEMEKAVNEAYADLQNPCP